jgi:two-component system OmpR family response regulator
VVLDLMLPRRDGFDVCRTLRERGSLVPILMLTARGMVDDRIRGLDAGADDYLAKPFDFGELLARVRALIRRGPRERPACLELGDLRVDPASHEVIRAGSVIELTAREFSVLEFLARHPGELVTRTRLLDHVWDANYEGSTNIVDVYVGYLRTKLEKPFGKPLIRTVRGAGFILDPVP